MQLTDKTDHTAYLRTDYWLTLSASVKKRDNNECMVCADHGNDNGYILKVRSWLTNGLSGRRR